MESVSKVCRTFGVSAAAASGPPSTFSACQKSEGSTIVASAASHDRSGHNLSAKKADRCKRELSGSARNELRYSTTEIKAALDAAYQAAFTAGGKLESTYDTIMAESSIKAHIVGGSGADAADAVNGYEGLKQYITRGGEYSATSPGTPISYKLRFLNNNEIGRIVLSSKYDLQDCELNPPSQTKTVQITLTSITSTNNCDWDDYTMDLYDWVKWDERGKYFWNATGHNNYLLHLRSVYCLQSVVLTVLQEPKVAQRALF